METHPIQLTNDVPPDWRATALIDLATSRACRLKVPRLFVLEYNGAPWTFATNGCAFIAVKGIAVKGALVAGIDALEPPANFNRAEILNALRVVDLMSARSHRSSVEELLQFCWEYVPDREDGEVCSHCSGRQSFPCPKCHGVGFYHCDQCGGDGVVDCNCKPGVAVPAVIDGRVFNLKFLLQVLKAAGGGCWYSAWSVPNASVRNPPRLNLKGDDWLASVAAIDVEPCSWMPVFRPEGGSAA